MAPKSFKLSDKLRAAFAAEKAGNSARARQFFVDILERYPANSKAKAGLKRLEKSATDPVKSSFSPEALSDPLQGLSAGGLSGLEDPLALPKKGARAAAAGATQNNLLATSLGGNGAVPGNDATESAEQLNSRGQKAHSQNRVHEAIALFRAAIDAQPKFTEARNSLGIALRDVGRFKEAAEVLEEAVNHCPEDNVVLCNLARVQSDMEDYDAAITTYKKALEIDTANPVTLGSLGNLYSALGRTDEAIECFETSIAHNPAYMSAYLQLSALRPFSEGDAIFNKLKSVLRKKKIPEEDQVYGHFALGSAFANWDDTKNAFDCFQKANRIAKSNQSYDVGDDKAMFSQIKSLFQVGKVSRLLVPEISSSPVTPIFVVGMPRSGSTLIEQVIASHSKVHGAGEIGLMTAIMDTVLNEATNKAATREISKDTLIEVRNTYLGEMSKISGPRTRVIDKNLLNFRYLGLIFAAFPEARVVHIQRNPMAVCWSIYRHNFAGSLMSFAYDLNDIAEFYNCYENLMQFWRSRFPNRFLDLRYETFTQDQEGETRRLLEYCGLDFEEACLNFQSTNRAARTASMAQVRKKVYQGSSQEWEKFKSYLTDIENKVGL
ncbi:Tetratricopeptide (TPR) repeat [Shimia gijangensis]|uniref:Tetratricopeptide (TPR) repeat n=1 Tax=Shimia gijangensis TaxID=1470563 RepID=A0A1M6REX2_9RHOB|nr:sulfotransferase [Shimia gijangensis]SHK31024.1 Tetratricopeptide (TPR) repeat [Shimia gijangensis]